MSYQLSEEDRAEIDEIRRDGVAEAAAEERVQVARVEDVDAGGVPARIYVPPTVGGALLYLHGGGFVFGERDTHDGIARRLADRTGWAVVLADYRRAPDHPFPAAVEDTRAASDWFVAWAAADLEVARLAVVGDSAGANLALGETLRNPSRYAAQVLVYPFVDPSGSTYDHDLPEAELGVEDCAWFWGHYLQDADPTSVDADPLQATSYAGLPRTLVQLAELDVLTPTGRLLADRLAADEVPTRVVVHPGVQHGFWRRTDNPEAEPALDRIAAFLAE